ncbi:hypothetical protein OAQ84_01000 [Bdellovibrionales bacterium]|nr:hypothetical protein [Bdellovibrionales bacterium]
MIYSNKAKAVYIAAAFLQITLLSPFLALGAGPKLKVNCTSYLSAGFLNTVVNSKENGTKINLPKDIEVFGRIIRGKSDADFITLSDDPNRKIVMVMDTEGLESISDSNNGSILEQVGYTRDYISELRSQGTIFKLMVFEKQEDVIVADWSGLRKILSDIYSEDLVKIFDKFRQKLENLSFEEIEDQGTMEFKSVYNAGPSSPLYVNSENINSDSSLWQFRAFLYMELRLTELFAGNGFTKTEEAGQGLREYFVINRPINLFENSMLLELQP